MLRGADLADQLDGADVDAEPEGCRGDERGELASAEPRLEPEPPVLGQASVVGRDPTLPEALPEKVGRRSARRRVFTKMRVVRWARTCVAMRSRISPHCSWDATASSSLSGSSMVRSSWR